MFRSMYFYLLAPVFIVLGATVLLVIPYLAVIVLLGVVLLALWGLARAAVAVSHLASRGVADLESELHTPAAPTAPALAPARRPRV